MIETTEFFYKVTGETFIAEHVPPEHRKYPTCHGCAADSIEYDCTDLCSRLPCHSDEREDGIAVIWVKKK